MVFQFTAKRFTALASAATLSIAMASCASGGDQTATSTDGAAAGGGSDLSGDVMIDGSSTVFPISEAMAEEFMAANSGVRVTVGVSGSGGGFEKFCGGETDISNASRPIKQSEIELCAENGIEFVEIPVAYDGLSVVVNPANDWVQCLTPDELGRMWEPAAEGQVTSWSQIKPDYPDQPMGLYGPGTDSGTYDYFTEAVAGEEGESRGDYTASEDDNVIVQGVQSDQGGLGFFGFAYYEENQDSLKIVPVENSAGECVTPSTETIADGTYNPLSRPLFVYFNTSALEEKPAVQAFADFLTSTDNEYLVSEVGYVPLPEDLNVKVRDRLASKTTGSIFEGGTSLGVKLADKL